MLIYRHELIQLGQQKNGQSDMDRYGAHKIGSRSFYPDGGKSLAAFAQSGLVLVRANMDPSGHNSIKKFLEIIENAVMKNEAVWPCGHVEHPFPHIISRPVSAI